MRLLLDLFDNVRTLEWRYASCLKAFSMDLVLTLVLRTEHDDLVLHEVLQCLQGLCSTKRALDKLADVAPTLFPHMLAMLFDEERRGPSEFSTRGRVISLLCMLRLLFLPAIATDRELSHTPLHSKRVRKAQARKDHSFVSRRSQGTGIGTTACIRAGDDSVTTLPAMV